MVTHLSGLAPGSAEAKSLAHAVDCHCHGCPLSIHLPRNFVAGSHGESLLADLFYSSPCAHVLAADDGAVEILGEDLQEAFALLSEIVRLAAPQEHAEPPPPRPGVAISHAARVELYAMRAAAGLALHHPGDVLCDDSVCIEADDGEGPLSRQSAEGLVLDRERVTAADRQRAARERSRAGEDHPFIRLAEQAARNSASYQAALRQAQQQTQQPAPPRSTQPGAPAA